MNYLNYVTSKRNWAPKYSHSALINLILLGIFSFLLARTGNAADNPANTQALKRWAILASPEISKTGLPDLLMLELQKIPGIEFVEREHIDAVLREYELKNAFGDRKERLELFKLIGADALIILSKEDFEDMPHLRLTICECRYGARLRNERIRFDKDQPDIITQLAGGMVKDTINRYSGGIKSIIGVSDFVSKCLSHDFDLYQQEYALILERALMLAPGIAVIEIDEARKIAEELAISGEQLDGRTIPFFVSGDFRVSTEPRYEDQKVSIEAKIESGANDPVLIRKDNLAHAEVKSWIATELKNKIIALLAVKPDTRLDADSQFGSLVRQADIFAKLGDWKHSTDLREAAILLKPDDKEQRLKILTEYSIIIGQKIPYEEQKVENPVFEKALNWKANSYLSATGHLEYLIRNRRINISEAIELFEKHRAYYFRTMIFAGSYLKDGKLYSPGENQLRLVKKDQRDLLEHIYKPVLDLPIPEDSYSRHPEHYPKSWRNLALVTAFDPVDISYPAKSDLDYVFKVLTEIVNDRNEPSFFRPRSEIVSEYNFLRKAPVETRSPFDSLLRGAARWDDWKLFYETLARSDSKMAQIDGRYGLIWLEWMEKEDEEDPDGLKPLMGKFNQFMGDYYKLNDWTYDEMKSLGSSIAAKCSPPPKTNPQKSDDDHEPRHEKPKEKDLNDTGRLVIEPLKVQIRKLDGKIIDAGGHRYETPSGWYGLKYLIPCGKDFDVVWQDGAVLFMREKGIFDEIFVDKKPGFDDVVWDGESVWVATRHEGIWVVGKDGKIKTRITSC